MNRSLSTLTLAAAAAPALLAGGLMTACQPAESTTARQEMVARQPSVELMASTREMLTGEVATFTISSNNIVGLSADVEWTTTGGQLITEEQGRIARARFDQPGAYTITSILMVDGREADRDSVTVNVRPLR